MSPHRVRRLAAVAGSGLLAVSLSSCAAIAGISDAPTATVRRRSPWGPLPMAGSQFTAETVVKQRDATLRLVEMSAGYVRADILDAEGDVSAERMLFPA